jgi:cadmium resistance transport/sequestration family protein
MEIFVTSVVAFATTNLDDIFLLTLFFSDPTFNPKNVVIGQYVGIAALVAMSLMGSFIGLIVAPEYIGLLGLIPMYIGVRSAFVLLQGEEMEDAVNVSLNPDSRQKHQAVAVASVTIANGGDNIGIYIPLFATLSPSEKVTMTFIFLIMTGIWCLLALYSSKHTMVEKMLKKYGHIITPFVFILLGLYIMYESNIFQLLWRPR